MSGEGLVVRAIDEGIVRAALAEVPDPELPVVSVVDLGMVGSVRVADDRIVVELLPTFVGCPAIEAIRTAVADRLARLAPGTAIEVALSFAEPWTSDRISPLGRRRLSSAGIAPPEGSGAPAAGRAAPPIRLATAVVCPFCGSRRTTLENAFGPTLCRTIRYCTDCRQPFEQLKTV